MDEIKGITVPQASMACMWISCAAAFIIPAALLIYLRKRQKADIFPFFAGCGVMLLFAFVFESACARALFSSAVGAKIQSSPFLYSLIGGAMAGLFEETGRYAAFRTVLNKYKGKDQNALMYGAGHGGFEAAVVLGIAMINNLTYSVLLNTGRIDTVTSQISPVEAEQLALIVRSLAETSPFLFLLGTVERVFAIVMHLSLSVFVWFAAKDKKKSVLYALAIVLHTAFDALTGYLGLKGMGTLLLEAMIGIGAFFCAAAAKKCWKKNHSKAQAEIQACGR
ncbi:MAG: YhfC family intramembrane metalloprotease [Eubacteriaceae bacterium]|nr:YhfC family intramembrane metalloprotease [Eubacteriaceae bacterium]